MLGGWWMDNEWAVVKTGNGPSERATPLSGGGFFFFTSWMLFDVCLAGWPLLSVSRLSDVHRYQTLATVGTFSIGLKLVSDTIRFIPLLVNDKGRWFNSREGIYTPNMSLSRTPNPKIHPKLLPKCERAFTIMKPVGPFDPSCRHIWTNETKLIVYGFSLALIIFFCSIQSWTLKVKGFSLSTAWKTSFDPDTWTPYRLTFIGFGLNRI